MKDYMSREFYTSLLYRSFSESLSHQEKTDLDRWLENAENARYAEEIREAWQLAEGYRQVQGMNLDEEFSNLQQRLKVHPTVDAPAKIRSFPWRWAIAAAFLIMTGTMTMRFFSSDQNGQTMEATTATEPISLDDGSVVWLNSGAKLQLAPNFGKEHRRMKLTGDAFFDVKHNSTLPFEVGTDSEIIQVLGTKFHVSQSVGESKVQLVEGRLRLQKLTGEHLVDLVAGEVFTLDRNRDDFAVTATLDQNAFAWKSDTLIFIGNPLSNVLATLEHHYQAEIQVENQIMESCLLHASFEQLPLDEVIETIASIFGMTVDSTSGSIVLMGGICQ